MINSNQSGGILSFYVPIHLVYQMKLLPGVNVARRLLICLGTTVGGESLVYLGFCSSSKSHIFTSLESIRSYSILN